MCALVKPTLLAQVSLRWVFICVCTHCLDTGLYRWLPLKWMKLGSKLQCEVRGEVSPAWQGFKVRGDAFIHYRQTDTFIHYRQTAGGEAGTLTCWRTHSPHTHLHTLSAGYLASHTHTHSSHSSFHALEAWVMVEGECGFWPARSSLCLTLQHLKHCDMLGFRQSVCFSRLMSRSPHAFKRDWRWHGYADLHQCCCWKDSNRQFKVFISWRENSCILWTHTNTPIKSYELISGYKPY